LYAFHIVHGRPNNLRIVFDVVSSFLTPCD